MSIPVLRLEAQDSHPLLCVVNRRHVWDALSVLAPGSVVGGFAIFFWAKLPTGCEAAVAAVEWIVQVGGRGGHGEGRADQGG